VIELLAFSVSGLRSLVCLESLPVRKPTIITGANDGGKSTTLLAVAFLLGAPVWVPEDSDHTNWDEAEAAQSVPPIVVEGRFAVTGADAAEFEVDEARIRRVRRAGGETAFELRSQQPVDPLLRDLEALKLNAMKELATKLGIEPDGKKNVRDSWWVPLAKHRDGQAHEEAWIPAPKEMLARLPRMMMFSSTDEPDPEGQIRVALSATYRELLDDEDLVGPVRIVENKVQVALAAKASELCEHVEARCPELSGITVRPEVTFSEGFRHVEVLAARKGGSRVPLNQSGAGRRRRINLAIWEWTGQVLANSADNDRAVVIAYDEPDTHLDYARQRELTRLIREQCERPGTRMLVATHSLNLIDRVAIEDVVHLCLDGEATRLERLLNDDHEEIQQYLVRVSDAMGLRNSVLLHERCFVGVEGPTELQALPVAFRLVTGMSMQSAGIALISGNGNDGALQVVRFLREHGRRLSFVVVDKDSTDRKIFRPEKLKGVGIDDGDIHYLGSRELEDLFTDKQWADVANREWPRTDGVKWEAGDFGGLRTASKFSLAIESVVREASFSAPQSKPGYLIALVQGLDDPADVPAQLAKVLIELAGSAAGDDAQPATVAG